MELAALHETCFADRKQFMTAMRDTAMIAQKEVLRKHNFAGLEDMKNALADHYVTAEGLSEREATAKSKAFVVGMESSRLTGWSWPKEEKVVSALKRDLVDAFNTEKFQTELATLHETCFADRKQFMAAMRDTAMIAQKEVLRKHNFAGLEN